MRGETGLRESLAGSLFCGGAEASGMEVVLPHYNGVSKGLAASLALASSLVSFLTLSTSGLYGKPLHPLTTNPTWKSLAEPFRVSVTLASEKKS